MNVYFLKDSTSNPTNNPRQVDLYKILKNNDIQPNGGSNIDTLEVKILTKAQATRNNLDKFVNP